MIILGHGGVMEKTYKFLEYSVFNKEGRLLNFTHEDGICENGGVENVCQKICRQVGCTGLVRIGELPGEDREEEESDDDRKDIFWGIKEDEVMDHLLDFTVGFIASYML